MDKLADITAQGWILAYFIRSDGERFLLGTGAYDFKSDLQHFQPNTMANDIVELQGTDGQLIAGQVRRSATQSFNGYVGDSTQNRERIEELRRDFLMFFRKNFFYKTVYIYPNGTAIQRKRGYIVDAPSVPELYQFFPEYHVALNYEDPNYYEYAEDAHGDEIFANILAITLTTPSAGGLVWDAIGAVSHGYVWSNPQTASGSAFQITGIEGAPLTLTEITGNATQDGTPTPDAPVAVNTTTGENVVKITGKNLFDKSATPSTTSSGVSVAEISTGIKVSDVNGNQYRFAGYIVGKAETYLGKTLTLSSTMTASGTNTPSMYIGLCDSVGQNRVVKDQKYTSGSVSYTVDSVNSTSPYIFLAFYANAAGTGSANNYVDFTNVQLELGDSASSFEPYQGQDYEVNLGKNLLENTRITTATTTNAVTATPNADGTISLSGTASALTWFVINNTMSVPAGTYTLSGGLGTGSGVAMYNDGWGGTEIAKTVTLASKSTGNWSIRIASGTNTNGMVVKPQLEKGSATSFAPYFTPIELAKIGTYQDRIYKDDGKWYVEKQVGKVVFVGDNSEGWRPTSGNPNYFYIEKSDVGFAPSDSTVGAIMSDNYTATTANKLYAATDDYGIAIRQSPNHQIWIRNKDCADKASFMTWLGTHNTTVYYALATPTTTEITDSTLLAQLNFIANLYGGTNNIMLVGTGAQGEIGVKYMTEVDTDGAGYEWEGGGGGGNTITLNVVEAVRPVWQVIGPATNPTLTNITTGETISFDGTVPAGQTLTVDMDARTATMAGANVFQFITGDWLRLEPGNNRISYTATGTTEPSTLSWNGVVG